MSTESKSSCDSEPTAAATGNRDSKASRAEYEIGYCRPPKATQFKKGRSGNPHGAKKKPKAEVDDVRLVIEDILAEPITFGEGNRAITVSKLEAMLRTQRNNALKGNPKAVKSLFRFAQKAGLFSEAKPKSNIVIDAPGGNPVEQMLIRAYHANKDPIDESPEGPSEAE